MKPKAVLIWLIKVVIAGIITLFIMSVFCYFYYNPEIHVPSKNGVTSYTREANTFWSRWTEGIARGTSDSNGYNNSYATDYSDVNILMLGSSQTEGLYVNEEDCISYRLNQYFDENDKELVTYNIGMSAHSLCRNVSNLPKALDTYNPSDYVIIETATLTYSESDINAAINGTMEALTSYKPEGFLYLLQKNPFIKLLYLQYKNWKTGQYDNAGETIDTQQTFNIELADQMMAYIEQIVSEKGSKVIIFYIPTIVLDVNGNAIGTASLEERNQYKQLCDNNGITFLDMTDTFIDNYNENRILPAGFANTKVGYGHMNRYGHEMVAQELYKIISQEMSK